MHNLVLSLVVFTFSFSSFVRAQEPDTTTPPAPPQATTAPVAPPPGPGLKPRPNRPVQPVPTPAAPPADAPADVKDMTNPAYLCDLAQVHLNYLAVDRAEDLLRKAIEHAKDLPMKTRARNLLASALQRKGDLKGASEIQESALTDMPEGIEKIRATLNLVDSFTQSQEYDKATALLEKLLAAVSDKNGAEAWLPQEIHNRYMRIWQAKPERAEADFTKAKALLEKDPRNAGLLELIVAYLTYKREPAAAVVFAEQIAELRPTDNSAQIRVAGLYQQAQQFDKAVAVYQKLMDNAPKESKCQWGFQIAQLYVNSNKKDEAAAYLKEKLAPIATQSWEFVSLASIFEQLAKDDDAVAMLGRAVELSKTPDEKADVALRQADYAKRHKDYAKAETILRGLLKEFKENKAVRTRAKELIYHIYQEQGKLDELKLDD